MPACGGGGALAQRGGNMAWPLMKLCGSRIVLYTALSCGTMQRQVSAGRTGAWRAPGRAGRAATPTPPMPTATATGLRGQPPGCCRCAAARARARPAARVCGPWPQPPRLPPEPHPPLPELRPPTGRAVRRCPPSRPPSQAGPAHAAPQPAAPQLHSPGRWWPAQRGSGVQQGAWNRRLPPPALGDRPLVFSSTPPAPNPLRHTPCCATHQNSAVAITQ